MKVVLNLASTCFFLSFHVVVFSQNLVRNQSFEDYHECPNTLGTFNQHVKSWSTPTAGTTDYFNSCSKMMSAPENFNGIQYPKDGNAYAGLYFYAPADYREYIQVALKSTLRANKEYTLSFHISLAEGSDFAVKDFGVICSYKQIGLNTKKELSKAKLYSVQGNKFHSFEVNHPRFHEDKTDWLKVMVTFVAKGYERYLILGNLRNNVLTRKVQTRRRETKKGAYYYIDQVVLKLNGKGEAVQPFALDSIHEFKNILFDFDDYQLNEISKKEVEALFDYLVQNPDIKVTINGHTDDSGNKDYNLILSKRRAKTIAEYLTFLGLSKKRIAYQGYGSLKPVAVNDTEENRLKNRRAAFVLSKK